MWRRAGRLAYLQRVGLADPCFHRERLYRLLLAGRLPCFAETRCGPPSYDTSILKWLQLTVDSTRGRILLRMQYIITVFTHI